MANPVNKKSTGTTVLALVVAAVLVIAQQLGWIDLGTDEPDAATGVRQTTPSSSDTSDTRGRHFITDLQNNGAADTPVTASGTIVKVLPDDNEGSRHQRFLVELSDGHVIKVSHNIDLAPRIPNPREGDTLEFKGDFEANELGGVVHWTHHDPRGRHEPGYLIHDGQKYE
ncbi:MAG: DUF3465 domain-containing protein [Planctomycetota bacterium]